MSLEKPEMTLQVISLDEIPRDQKPLIFRNASSVTTFIPQDRYVTLPNPSSVGSEFSFACDLQQFRLRSLNLAVLDFFSIF